MSDDQAGRRLLPLDEQKIGLLKEGLIIQAEAQSRLRKSGYHQLHLISCEFHEGVLTLRGHVSSFHLKQVCADVDPQTGGRRRDQQPAGSCRSGQ